mmetsp:Transcript_21155/g.37913  ORF Transcript_21155/g.37913 Transcript_21155/m.37913 type:complete len:215 (-) Transcript_21155:358-1002(-)
MERPAIETHRQNIYERGYFVILSIDWYHARLLDDDTYRCPRRRDGTGSAPGDIASLVAPQLPSRTHVGRRSNLNHARHERSQASRAQTHQNALWHGHRPRSISRGIDRRHPPRARRGGSAGRRSVRAEDDGEPGAVRGIVAVVLPDGDALGRGVHRSGIVLAPADHHGRIVFEYRGRIGVCVEPEYGCGGSVGVHEHFYCDEARWTLVDEQKVA